MKLFSFLTTKKKGAKTLEEYLQIVKNEPDNPGLHMKIADLYMKKGKKDKAVAEYISAAEGYSKEELYQLAMSIYKTVLSIEPTLIPVYVTLAELYERRGFIGDAAVTYEKLAHNYLKDGNMPAVRDVAERMVNLDPSNQFIRKRAYRFLTSVREAEAAARSETFSVPRDVEEELLTVEPYGGEGGQSRAVDNRRPAESFRQPDDVLNEKDYFDLGAHLDDGGELVISPEAVSFSNASSMEVDTVFEGIRQNIEEGPKEEGFRLHYELGIAYQQMERIDDAIEEFKKALSDPDVRNDCFLRLSGCFREREMYKHAINAARSGLKSRFISQSEFLGLHYELGLTYAAMGEEKKALGSFLEIAKVDANYRDTRQIIEEMKGQS